MDSICLTIDDCSNFLVAWKATAGLYFLYMIIKVKAGRHLPPSALEGFENPKMAGIGLLMQLPALQNATLNPSAPPSVQTFLATLDY